MTLVIAESMTLSMCWQCNRSGKPNWLKNNDATKRGFGLVIGVCTYDLIENTCCIV